MTATWVDVEQLLLEDDDDQLEGRGSPWSFLELLHLSRPAWQADAACAGADPGLFFPEQGESAAPACAICAGCPVRDECLRDAVADSERPGVWGGTSRSDRRRLRTADPSLAAAPPTHLLGAMEAAERLGVDRSTVSRWIKAGHLSPAGRDGNRMLFEPADVDRLRR